MIPHFLQRKLQARAMDRAAAAKLGRTYGLSLDGHSAFVRGDTPADCPHVLDSPDQRAWMAGWLSAFDRRFR